MKKLLLGVCSLILMACAGKTATVATVTDADLVHHRYDLVSINGQKVTPMTTDPVRQPRIEFNEGMQVSGVMCNNFSGPLKLVDGKYQGLMMSTMMACVDEALTKSEATLFKAFAEGAEVKLSGNEMTIGHKGNVLLFELNDYR